jgi:hypothetical protein
MANEKKKYVWLAVVGVALATLLVYWSIFWPPVPRNWVQGAIGKRDVYRQAQMTDKDIGVAGTTKVTVDDVRKFLQSPEFQSLSHNAQFNQLVANAQFQHFFQHGASIVFANQAQVAQNQAQVAQNQVHEMMNQAQLAQNQAQIAQNQAQLAQNQSQVVQSSQANLSQNAQFQQLMNTAQFSQLQNNAQFIVVLAMPGFQAMMMNSSQFTQLASQSQLSNLVNNTALQQALMSQANFQGQ